MTDTFQDLPKAPAGEPPDEHPRWGSILVDWCHERARKHDEEWDANHQDPKRFYHSDAGKCSRAIAYAALRVPSEPVDAPGAYNMWLGSFIHEAWQAALVEKFPDAKIELQVQDDDSGGRIDAVVELETGNTKPYVIAIELKSMNGMGFKKSSAGWSGSLPGPRNGDKLQCFLNAKRIDADEAVVVYLSKEANNWVKEGLDPLLKVTAEWTFTREQYMPLADEEDERIHSILQLVDEGSLPRRYAPDIKAEDGFDKHIIVEPSTGAYLVPNEKGEWIIPPKKNPHYWGCSWCRYQTTCAQTGADREPIDVLVKIGALEAGNGEGEARDG